MPPADAAEDGPSYAAITRGARRGLRSGRPRAGAQDADSDTSAAKPGGAGVSRRRA
jgi:hypothetical protein